MALLVEQLVERSICSVVKTKRQESELKKLEKVVVSALKVKGKGTRTIRYPVIESEQGARENMCS